MEEINGFGQHAWGIEKYPEKGLGAELGSERLVIRVT